MIRNADQGSLHHMFNYLKSFKKGKATLKLPTIRELEKQKPNPSTLSISGNLFSLNDLQNHSLQKLYFQSTSLIPKCTWNLVNLTQLYLVNCDLDKVPPKLIQLKNIKILSLAKNKLVTLDSKLFANLTSLLSLDASHNQLCFIPLEIAVLKPLTTINFNHNQIKHLPYSIAFLPKLKEVNVADNLINSLSFALLVLITSKLSLIKLDLSGNPFNCSPKSHKIIRIPKLISLTSGIILSRLKLIKVLHEWIPRDVYQYIQQNAEICSFCHKPFVGPDNFKLHSTYNLTKLASTVISDHHLNSHITPVLYFCSNCFNK